MKEIRTQFDLTNHILLCIRKDSIGHYEKSVLVAISCHVNPNNGWMGWPSVDTIMDITIMSRSSVFRALDSLKKLGVIEYEKGKNNVSNKYRIVLEKLNEMTDEKARYSVAHKLSKIISGDDFDSSPF